MFFDWKATQYGLSDWSGTDIEFAISSRDDKTTFHFRHSRWRDYAEYLPDCSMSWAVFLLSLKELLEKGTGFPFLNHWNHQ